MRKLLFISLLAFSANTLSQESESNSRTTQYADSSKGASPHQLTNFEKKQAKQWSLTETDWSKYKKIMKGPRGIWSPNLDPITALGVSEVNETERRRYADIWMKVETRRISLELAFEVERMAAGKRLHGDTKLIDNDAWIAEWKSRNTSIDTKVSFFVDANCIENCKTLFYNLNASVGTRTAFDIYFSSGATAESAGAWAAGMNIDPKDVRNGKITLNFDEGDFAILGIDESTLPQVRVLNVATGVTKSAFTK